MIKNTNIMIKKLAGIIVVAAVATVTGWNINQSMKEVVLSDLALANVEALAGSGEYDPNTAYGYDSVECKKDGRVTGSKCEAINPHGECKYSSNWGKCN